MSAKTRSQATPDGLTDVHLQAQARQSRQITSARETAPQSNETAAREIFKEVRLAYSNGLKSGNKTYSHASGKYEADVARQKQAASTVDLLHQQSRENTIYQTPAETSGKLVIDAGNCSELSRVSARIATSKGLHAEVWRFNGADHAFAVIGSPPTGTTVDFSDWKNTWIVDPWLNVVAEGPDYIKKANQMMKKWDSSGKVMIQGKGHQLSPTDSTWLDAINKGSKSAMEVPTLEKPNPWASLTTAVDYRRKLANQDRGSAPLKIGGTTILRTDLFDMGVILDGKPIDIRGIRVGGSDGLADRISFDSKILNNKLREYGENGDQHSVDRLSNILTEVSSNRLDSTRTPLLVSNEGVLDRISSTLNNQLDKLRDLTSKATHPSAESNPGTFLVPGKSAIALNNVGVGLQAFGIYNGVRGMTDAIARGDTTEAIISASGLAAEGASLGAEIGFNTLGKSFENGSSTVLANFSKSSLGKALGGQTKIGSTVSRVGGLAGGALSAPFDVYGTVTSFDKSIKTTGKEAQDHLVDGTVAFAGIATSGATIGASLAGAPGSGRAGMVAAALLIAGSRIYHSVRYVEDLGEHTDLSAGEKFVTGTSSFFGGGAPQDVEDRVAASKSNKNYKSAKRNAAAAFLDKNPEYGSVIFGDATVTPQPPKVQYSPWGDPEEITQLPASIKDNSAPDIIDARNGTGGLENAVESSKRQGDKVLWATGEGADMLHGVTDRDNHFVLDKGKKNVVGGRQDDLLELRHVPDDGSTLEGGDGTDTLKIDFPQADDKSTVWIGLSRVVGGIPGETQATTVPGHLRGVGRKSIQLGSIENVITSKTAHTFVMGNEQNNAIILNGHSDAADGGPGNDDYVINGSGEVNIEAGSGNNRYWISNSVANVNINSDAPEGTHDLILSSDSSELSVQAIDKSDKLEITLKGAQSPRKVVISNVFSKNPAGEFVPMKKDGSISLRTRDGFILTPTLSSIGTSQGGRLHLGAMYAVASPPQPTQLPQPTQPGSSVARPTTRIVTLLDCPPPP